MSQTRKQARLSALPSIDALLKSDEAERLRTKVGPALLTRMARQITEELRRELLENAGPQIAGNGDHSRQALMAEAGRRLELACTREQSKGLRRVINASGVILHTNLGRAPLSGAAREAIAREAAGYCTLEFDLETGLRGRRGARVEQLLAELTGAEAALVVNNCAAATLLVLTVLAKGGEAIVSRGELVEIGGDFRVPDVMKSSGTTLVEVGTTNRTRLSDYAEAINWDTQVLMHVHPSNYRIVGFTSAPTLTDLADLAHSQGVILYVDAGSGALRDLSEFGLDGEPIIGNCVKEGADVVTFSGDKLLGASQAGLIVGRAEIVEQLRTHPLYRALRADKLALASIEATLDAHRRDALAEVPTLRMIALSAEEIRARAESILSQIRERVPSSELSLEIIDGQSAIGGGSAPTTNPPTALIAIAHPSKSPDQLAASLRGASVPVVSRIAADSVVLDLRTVAPEEESELIEALLALNS